eukprot:TRINITY_DN36157_c0_g1_i1.p1 TRINITY_DN36157_c0_g1~~TRINITY_DN36157_c0_g1_i1.p1  ORF type:complete len:232 (-),score=46.96 TRINITY_DN36157_c0_g1_i1:281-892(-)
MSAGSVRATRHQTSSLDIERLDRIARSRGREIKREEFNAEQLAECKHLFQQFDRNNDNTIDIDEFRPMMRCLGLSLTQRELDVWFEKMDTSGDGLIQLSELVDFLQQISRHVSREEELGEAFRFFAPPDENEDEHAINMTPATLAAAMRGMGEDVTEAECASMIAGLSGGAEAMDYDMFKSFARQRPAAAVETGHGLRLPIGR